MLSLKQLQDMPPHTVFATGIISDDRNGINMANTGSQLRWVAKRGQIHDWAIYIHFAYNDEKFIREQGDKVTDKENIKKLVPCDDEALEMYRF